MRSLILLALALNLVVPPALCGGDDKVPSPSKESYVKVRVEVEVRGVLRQTDKRITVSSRFKVHEMFNESKEIRDRGTERPPDVFDLDFVRAKKLRELAETLRDKEVLVTGMCELRMVVQPGRPGGLTGAGSPGPLPVPTWSLQRTVLVTGLKSAG